MVISVLHILWNKTRIFVKWRIQRHDICVWIWPESIAVLLAVGIWEVYSEVISLISPLYCEMHRAKPRIKWDNLKPHMSTEISPKVSISWVDVSFVDFFFIFSLSLDVIPKWEKWLYWNLPPLRLERRTKQRFILNHQRMFYASLITWPY